MAPTTTASAPPVRYTPNVETPKDDEAKTSAELVETLLEIARTMQEHTGHGLRSVHAKSFGLLRGTLTVLDGLPPELAQGVFARPGSHEVIARMSTPPAEELDDRVSLPRGLALKVLGVEGERLPGSEASTTQDWLMVNGPVFNAPDAESFLRSLKLLAATTDRVPTGKRMLSVVLRGTAKALDAVGVESPKLMAMGGHPETHPLGETFFTQLPIRYGDYIAKLQVAPVAASLTALTDQPLEVQDEANGLREAVNNYFAAHDDAEWELRVQLCTDLESMPIEDASVEWPEAQSPYRTVARLRIPRQTGWSEERSRAVDDGLAFDPWNGIAAHQPLGNVMRARREAYKPSAAFRAQANGCPMHQPRAADAVLPRA
ncbi:catalase family protein [uncultured Xylophilus sp.]|uniref:catalase family protein n=1 Tax=uncultured Xylophilus sp. TaxID=296832 RepID=UPI0025EF5A31|nr:catalase family protein [uncultured Xylophilus sp.]